MTELSGTLDGVGLPAIIRFLGRLKKSGCLRITEDGWQGEIFFDGGQVRDVQMGTPTGLAVVDALVETLPGGSFAFDSQALHKGEPSIRLRDDALQAHLDELSDRVANRNRQLPRPNAVLVHRPEDDRDAEPLLLDRASLQTLLAIDGKRSMLELVAQRGTFDALWHVATLIEAGLVEVGASAPPEAVVPVAERVLSHDQPSTHTSVEPATATIVGSCPKLGFEDDAGTSFDRPTRLHRCFAAGTPLPLSLDQQRELCLSDHFATCPRLSTVSIAAPRPSQPNSLNPQRRPAPAKAEPDDSRIVRIPFGGRTAAPGREAVGSAAAEPTRQRATGTASASESNSDRPRPLRARMERTVNTQATSTTGSASAASSNLSGSGIDAGAAATAVLEPPTLVRTEPTAAHVQARVAPQAQLETLKERRFRGSRIGLIAAAGITVLALGVAFYLYSGQLGGLFGDDRVDPSALPNTSRVAAGTPVSALPLTRATPAPSGNRSAGAAQPATGAVVAQPAGADPAAQTAVGPASAQPGGRPTPAPTGGAQVLLDEHFGTNSAKWPSSPQGVASLGNGTYRVVTQQAGQFVAIGAPITNLPADVVVSATFRKLAGPSGGGYGIIVRDQETGAHDGARQDGRYYVVEVGDKGDVGMWRREIDHWVDLLVWQPSNAVKRDTATNEVTVRAVGNTLTLSVNGVQVAMRSDNTLATGGVGLFVGGDGNQVAVEHFSVQTP
jgi:hypothetical protein